MNKVSAIYVIELFPGKVKIGQTTDWETRLSQYTHSGIIEPVTFQVFPLPAIFLRGAESVLLERTMKWQIKGEWRFCDFETIASLASDLHTEIECGNFEMPEPKRPSLTRKPRHDRPNSVYVTPTSAQRQIRAYEVRKRV